MESILTSIKKLLGIAAEDTSFDMDIISHINSVLSTLWQIGVGPSEGFAIFDDYPTWNDFIPDNSHSNYVLLRSSCKTYMHAKVKLAFDPPPSSAHIESLERIAREEEWRLNHLAEFTTN